MSKKTEVVHLKKSKYDIYIGRPGKGEDGYFGNPFDNGSREENIKKFERYFYFRLRTDPEFKRRVEALRGKVLGCFCSPLQCHGDTMIEYIDAGPALRKRLLENWKL